MNRQGRRERGHEGRSMGSAKLREEIRRLQVQLESMEVGTQQNSEGGDVSEAKEEIE